MKYKLVVFLLLAFSVRVFGQCTFTVNITASTTSVCNGTAAVLTANPSGGQAPYTYLWTKTGETSQTISTDQAGVAYIVNVKDAAGCIGTTSITLAANPTPGAPTAPDAIACPNTTTTLTASGSTGSYQWYNADGTFRAGGATITTDIITQKTSYYVETTVNGCTSARTTVNVFPISGPTVITGSTCPGSSVTFTAAGAGDYKWYDNPSASGNPVGTGATFTTPSLFATTNYYVVGTTAGCVSLPTTATATVINSPAPPTVLGVSTCSGSVATLHASGAPNTVFDWFDVPTGGTSLISSPDYTTPALTASKTYYVQATIGQCVGSRTAVTVTINPIPADPVLTDVTGCFGSSLTITPPTPTDGGTYNWYATATSFKSFATGNSYTINNLTAPVTYYVEAVSAAGCVSSGRKPINILVNPIPDAPVVSGPTTICANNVTTLTATGPAGATYDWYTTPTGGTSLTIPSSANFTTPALISNTTYYVQATVNGCISSRTPVKVTVNPAPPTPTATGPTGPLCAGSPVTLTATGTGVSFEWYDAPTGGSQLSSGAVYNISAISATTTYYVQTTDNIGCPSPRNAITVTVNQLPPQPTITGVTTLCAGNKTTLTATSAGATSISWYANATTTTALFTGGNGSTYTTLTLGATKTYYVSASNGTCESLREPVTITVYSGDQFAYSSGTYCKLGGVNPVPVIKIPGGKFSATPAGLIIDPNTGVIDIGASPINKYTVLYTNGCAITNRVVRIVNTPDAGFSYGGTTFCQGSADIEPVYTDPLIGGGGVFTVDHPGILFGDGNTGSIDMTGSTPGTYKITNTIDATTAGCTTVTASTTITIVGKVAVNAGPDQTVATGTTVQLAGSITPAGTTGKWSGGTGTFSPSATDLKATYTPASGETRVTLTLTSDATACSAPVTNQVVLTFNPQPPPPIVSKVSPVCSGSQIVLSANGTGTSYQWYDAATGGTLLFTGKDYPVTLVVATTTTYTYYAQTTLAGVASTRTPITFTVNPLPDAPTFDPVAPVCPGTTATIIAKGSSGTYNWYTVPTGGIAFFHDASYTTGILTAGTSYYVEAVSSTGCVSPTRTEVDVAITTLPKVTSPLIDNVCSGTALNYTILADLPGTTFTYSRAVVPNISNPAVTDVASGTITEPLINISNNPVNVKYMITPTFQGCSGTPVPYVVTVYPTPTALNTTNTASVCSSVPSPNPVYKVNFSVPGTVAAWSRDAVPGIANQPVSGQISNAIYETLYNNTAAPIDVTYKFTYATANCEGSTYNVIVTVKPTATITSSLTGTACSSIPQAYAIESNVPSANFSWIRSASPEINNNTAGSNTVPGKVVDETLVNTSTKPVDVTYVITASENACSDKPFIYTVTVSPQIPTPTANAPKSICAGKTITLDSPTIYPGATYHWTGPNGFTSATQTPTVTIDNATAANSGQYTLYLQVGDCSSLTGTADVAVIDVPKVNAGQDMTICPTQNVVKLDGSVLGGSNKGIWSINGVTDSRLPDPTNATGNYIPTAADVASGSVTLALTYTGPDVCDVIYDEVVIKFGLVPGTDAGPDQEVCSQATTVVLDGKMILAGNGTWTTSGKGKFNASDVQPNGGPSPIYMVDPADIAAGSIQLFLTANNPDPACYKPTDTVTLTFMPPPTVSAGDTKFVLKGNKVVLTPKVSDPNVHYLWSPNTLLDNDTLKNPTVTGDVDQVYTLTVTDSRGCVATSSVAVTVAPPIVIPNTFTPNGDGINDVWDIQGLIAYTSADVNIYDRNGQRIFHSIGYGIPWNGTYNNKPLPFGTYYYVIDPKFFYKTFSGYITLVK